MSNIAVVKNNNTSEAVICSPFSKQLLMHKVFAELRSWSADFDKLGCPGDLARLKIRRQWWSVPNIPSGCRVYVVLEEATIRRDRSTDANRNGRRNNSKYGGCRIGAGRYPSWPIDADELKQMQKSILLETDKGFLRPLVHSLTSTSAEQADKDTLRLFLHRWTFAFIRWFVSSVFLYSCSSIVAPYYAFFLNKYNYQISVGEHGYLGGDLIFL